MATDEPDSDPVSKGLEQLRTRSGSSYGVPPPSPSAARGRPRAAKASSAPADTRVGFGREEPAAEEGKSGGTVLGHAGGGGTGADGHSGLNWEFGVSVAARCSPHGASCCCFVRAREVPICGHGLVYDKSCIR